MSIIELGVCLNKRVPNTLPKGETHSAGDDYWWVALSGQLGESQVYLVVVVPSV